jgi:hypothetical protein
MTEEATELVHAILRGVCDDLTGEGERYAEVDEDTPSSMFPAGTLSPRSGDPSAIDDFRVTQFSPSSIGLFFRVRREEPNLLALSGGFNVYFPTKPTITKLRQQVARYEGSSVPLQDWESKDPAFLESLRNVRLKFRPVYRRLRIDFSAEIDVATLALDKTYHPLEGARLSLSSSITKARAEADRHGPWLVSPVNHRALRILPGVALTSQEEYDRALSEQSTPMPPRWSAEIVYRAWREPGSQALNIEVLLSNTIDLAPAGRDMMVGGLEPCLFSPVLRIQTSKNLLEEFVLAGLSQRDYRNYPIVLSSGVNCDTLEQVVDGSAILSTDILPVYHQPPLRSRTFEGPHGAPTFEQLDADPIPILRGLVARLEDYGSHWRTGFPTFVGAGKVQPTAEADYRAAEEEFATEAGRFREAVETLSLPANSDLLLAFRLVNRVFARQHHGQFSSWRLFQLVFLVTRLAEFRYRVRGGPPNPPPPPVVLSIATGSGKTEAYLSLILAHAFWDRLRGKNFGTTAWCKFPLRLLSMQQFGRFVSAIVHANEVLSSAPEIPDRQRGEQFSVGLFAGGENSSNDLDWPNGADRPTTLNREFEDLTRVDCPADHPLLVKNRKIDVCPVCSFHGFATPGRVIVRFDPTKPGFIHECEQCRSKLPLHVSDTEVLRFLPTIVVSTIDKMAELGREPATKILFGYARSQCATHGFFLAEAGNCNVLGCGRPTRSLTDLNDPGPGILVQDEMHFLRESLGAFDSHYETMMLAIQDEAAKQMSRHGGRWRIVGSSATIEGYADQVAEIYATQGAIRFPSPGPVKGESFYFEEISSDVQRFVLGFRPHGMSHVDAVMKVLLSYHRMIAPLADHRPEAWANLGQRFSALDRDQREKLISRYRTSLAYCLTRPEAGQVNKSFVGQLNPKLDGEGLPQFEDSRVENLTSEMGAANLQRVLHRLETPSGNWIQAVSATSIIGHGVDLETLNFMVFRGQPHTIAEWIQAMSRVGRKSGFPSVVVNVYNPNRERDASYYRHHKGYIGHADSLLRNVPVTRFSRTAAGKTFPGLFYNAVSYFTSPPECRYYYTDQLRRYMPQMRTQLEALLERYYAIPPLNPSPKEARLDETLESEMERTLAIVEYLNSPERTLAALRPMTSLREVEERVTITPDYDYGSFK